MRKNQIPEDTTLNQYIMISCTIILMELAISSTYLKMLFHLIPQPVLLRSLQLYPARVCVCLPNIVETIVCSHSCITGTHLPFWDRKLVSIAHFSARAWSGAQKDCLRKHPKIIFCLLVYVILIVIHVAIHVVKYCPITDKPELAYTVCWPMCANLKCFFLRGYRAKKIDWMNHNY